MKLSGPAPSEVFTFRKFRAGADPEDIPLRIQLLTTEQMMNAIISAQHEAKRRKEIPKEYGDAYHEAQAHELLAWALRREELEDIAGTQQYRRVFVSAQQVRDAFTEPEQAYLLNCYELVKAKYGILEDLEDEDIEEWVSRLADGMRGVHFLAQLDSRQYPAALLRMAQWAARLCQRLGYQLPDSLDGSESTSETLGSGTSYSTEPPVALSTTGDQVDAPHDRVLTREEARASVRSARKKRAKAAKTDGAS